MTPHPEGNATMLPQSAVQPVKVSLKVKALVFISLMILAVGASLSWYFLRQAQGVLTGELQRRALSLTKNLASASQYGVLTRDEVILRQLIEGILQEDSVLLALITDTQGTVLAQGSREREDAAAKPYTTALTLHDIAAPASPVTAPQSIIVSSAIAASTMRWRPSKRPRVPRREHLAAELLLMGTASDSALSPTPQTVRRGQVQILLSPESMQADIRKTFVTGIGLTWGLYWSGSSWPSSSQLYPYPHPGHGQGRRTHCRRGPVGARQGHLA